MPARKSNASQVAATTADETTPTKERDGINIEDLSLPRTMVQRLAKGVLPSNTQIQKDALTAMSKAATVFINYLSQAANTTAAYSTRKTIAPEAVLDALDEIEFADFVPRVQAELKKFNEVQTGKRNEYRRKLKEKEGDKGDKADVTGHGEERAAKRVRREGAATANTTKAGATKGGGANREAQRGKEEGIDREGDEQPEDENLTEEFDAEPEVAEADEGNTEEQDDEEEEEENDDDDDDDDDLSGVEQDDVDIDDADLRERTVGRGRRGDDDGDDGNSSESDGESGSEGE